MIPSWSNHRADRKCHCRAHRGNSSRGCPGRGNRLPDRNQPRLGACPRREFRAQGPSSQNPLEKILSRRSRSCCRSRFARRHQARNRRKSEHVARPWHGFVLGCRSGYDDLDDSPNRPKTAAVDGRGYHYRRARPARIHFANRANIQATLKPLVVPIFFSPIT